MACFCVIVLVSACCLFSLLRFRHHSLCNWLPGKVRLRNGKVFWIGTVHYNWPMFVHASQAFNIAHCTNLEDLTRNDLSYPTDWLTMLCLVALCHMLWGCHVRSNSCHQATLVIGYSISTFSETVQLIHLRIWWNLPSQMLYMYVHPCQILQNFSFIC